MKVLVISYMFPCKRHPISGIFFANLLKELASKLDELVVITPRPYIPKFLTKFKKDWDKWFIDPFFSKEGSIEIIRPYVLNLKGVSYDGVNAVLTQYSLLHLVKNLIIKKQIDLILGYNMIPEGITVVGLANKLNLPVAFWAIGSDVNTYSHHNRINYYLSKKSIENSDLVITESKDLEMKVRSFTQKAINVKTFYKGIHIGAFQNLPERHIIINKLSLDPQKKYLLFVGRLSRDKGIYEIAAAFVNIAGKYHNHDLIMIGEEIEKEKIMMTLRENGLQDRVQFRGIVSHSDVAHYMKIAELLVLPTWAEGLPNVVMEAMAIGLPVVASNVDGIPEVLQNEVTGISVPAKNVDKLTDAVTRMLDDSALRETCIANAKKMVYDNFDVNKNVNLLYDMLVEIKNNHLPH